MTSTLFVYSDRLFGVPIYLFFITKTKTTIQLRIVFPASFPKNTLCFSYFLGVCGMCNRKALICISTFIFHKDMYGLPFSYQYIYIHMESTHRLHKLDLYTLSHHHSSPISLLQSPKRLAFFGMVTPLDSHPMAECLDDLATAWSGACQLQVAVGTFHVVDGPIDAMGSWTPRAQ